MSVPGDILRRPDTKERIGRIVVLLDHLPDYFDTAARDDGPSGDGGVYLLPGMSRHRSVVELGRALESLWLYAPGCSAHLFAYYAAPWRTRRLPKVAKDKHGRRITLRGDPADPASWAYERERVLPPWVRTKQVEVGVRFIAQEPRSPAEEVLRPWCFRGPVFLPAPLLEKPSDSSRVAA